MIPQPGVAPSPALASGLDGVPTSACSRTLPPHLIETTARPFLPHPRQRSRPLMSSTFAPGLSPLLSRASGVSSATWWQAAQSTLTQSPSRDPRSAPHRGGASGAAPEFLACSHQTVPTPLRQPPTALWDRGRSGCRVGSRCGSPAQNLSKRAAVAVLRFQKGSKGGRAERGRCRSLDCRTSPTRCEPARIQRSDLSEAVLSRLLRTDRWVSLAHPFQAICEVE